MTKADAAKLIGIIIAAYPNFDKFKSNETVRATVDLWATMFSEDDSAVVGLATRKYIATNKYPPSVAEIRELMLETQAPDLIEPNEAWEAVVDYMQLQGEYGGTAKMLPPLIDRAVNNIGYHNLFEMNCSRRGSKPGAARTAFLNAYTPLYEKERQEAMTPKDITRQIKAIAADKPKDRREAIAIIRERRKRMEQAYYDVSRITIEEVL